MCDAAIRSAITQSHVRPSHIPQLMVLYRLLSKCTSFVSLFVSNHLVRVQGNDAFPITEFLSIFFKYTFMQTNPQGFLACIDIWIAIMDAIVDVSAATPVQAALPALDAAMQRRY
jgi:hypothetical protein